MKLSGIKTDKSKQEGGVWITYEGDFEVCVARLNNDAFTSFMRAKGSSLRKGGRSVASMANSPKTQATLREGIANHVLKDWRGLTDDDETPIEFSPAKAIELFKDDELVDFWNFVIAEANDADNFRKEAIEEDAGN